jgi:hypothetical protein
MDSWVTCRCTVWLQKIIFPYTGNQARVIFATHLLLKPLFKYQILFGSGSYLWKNRRTESSRLFSIHVHFVHFWKVPTRLLRNSTVKWSYGCWSDTPSPDRHMWHWPAPCLTPVADTPQAQRNKTRSVANPSSNKFWISFTICAV